MALLLIFRRKLINFLCLITLVFCTLSSYSQDIAQPSLDIDGNGKYDALTDGLLVLRNMFGLEGEALVNGALAPDAIYTSAPSIQTRIENLGLIPDIDGDGKNDALTDGLIILRYLFGLRDEVLINGTISSNAKRLSVEEIHNYLLYIMADSDGDEVLDINDAFPLDSAEWIDTDLDGIGNNADRDDDNDFIPDGIDDFPLDPELGESDNLIEPDGGLDEDNVATLSGTVVDGYVSGAFAFLDLDFDGKHDQSEPSGITDEFGKFELRLSGAALQCESLAPIVVDVPVGAFDSEQGEVTEAYQMVSPPAFASEYIQTNNLMLSPLTSALWTEIKSILGLVADSSLACSALASEVSQQQAVKDALKTAIRSVVKHYNLTEEQIYQDFISLNNDSAKQSALEIVKGLKLGFKETAELRKQMPSAAWAEVSYYKFSSLDNDDAYPDAWYRELNYKDGQLAVFELSKMTSDLTAIDRLIVRGEREYSQSGQLKFQREREYESRGGDNTSYSCNNKEQATFNNANVEYELVNLASQSGVNSSEECSFTSFTESIQSRYLFIRIFNSDGTETGAQFIFDIANNGYTGLSDWVDFIELDASLSAVELGSFISTLPYYFCANEKAGAISVTRSRSLPLDNFNLVISRQNDGTYELRRDYPDGRSETEYLGADALDCALYDGDIDSDGVPDGNDEDIDGDSFINSEDAFPTDAAEWLDSDGDGVGDNSDAFVNDVNESVDTDGDGIGNNADADDDGDLILDINDAFPLDMTQSIDTDSDGISDGNDSDSDNDGLEDLFDLFPLDPLNQFDFDGDGIGDFSDTDDDNDGVLDTEDTFPTNPEESVDTDGDGVGDNADEYPEDETESADTDGDGVGDNTDAYPLNSEHHLAWADRNYLADFITRAQAATIRITSSTGVIIAPKYAITAAHSPLDGDNEITPNLIAENAWGEKRKIIDVLYDVDRDFAIVEFETPFEKFGTIPLASGPANTGSEAFMVGNPGYAVEQGLTRSVSFGTVANILEDDGFEKFTDFHIFGGYSGSGIYNNQGELLGILSMANCCMSSPFYDDTKTPYNTTWDQYRLENAYAVPLDYIESFLTTHNVVPELVQAPELPKNKLDRQKRPLMSPQELSELEPIASVARQATVALWPGTIDQLGNNTRHPLCTGALVGNNLVLTAAHCVEGRGEFTVGFTGREVRQARLLDKSYIGDVAILELTESAPPQYPILIMATEPMQVGDIGVMVGHPKDQYYEFGGWIVSTIKSYPSDKGWASFWGHSGKGASGGPLINHRGEIVGVLTASSAGGNYTVGGYDKELFYDIQDPHLQDTSPWPSPRTISFQSFAGNIEEHAGLAYHYLHKNGLSRVLDGTLTNSFIYELKEQHQEDGRIGKIIKRERSTGQLDLTFGDSGILNLPHIEGKNLVPRKLEVLASGHIVVLADNSYQPNASMSLIEYDVNGGLQRQQFWSSSYLHGRDLHVENDQIFIAADFFNGENRDAASVRCSALDSAWACTDLRIYDSGGHDHIAGVTTTESYAVLGGFVDPLKRARDTDVAALYLDKDTMMPASSIGSDGLVLVDRASGDDDAERVYSIKPTSDGGVMLIGYEWSAFVSAPMAVKLDSQGTVDINFGDQGLFRTMTTSKHLKGLAQLNTMIETNDYYVFFGSQNFGGYAGLKLEYYVEEIEKTVFGRNNDLTMLVVNKNGTFADVTNPVVYFDSLENDYLVGVEESNGEFSLVYRDEFGDALKQFDTTLLHEREVQYLSFDITNSPVKYHNEAVEAGSNLPEITCRALDQIGQSISIEFNYLSFSDKDDMSHIIDSYWLINGQPRPDSSGVSGYINGRVDSLELGIYEYVMSYQDGRGNVETIETLPFDYKPELCPFSP